MNRTVKENQADVAVFGAGPAGVSAAYAAARQGAKVVLVERYPQVGGMSTLIPISMWPIITAEEIGNCRSPLGDFPLRSSSG